LKQLNRIVIVFRIVLGALFISGCADAAVDKAEPSPTAQVSPTRTPTVQPTEDLSEDYYQQGMDALNNGDYDSAIEFFNLMLELDPDDGEAYLGRGRSYGSQGQFDLAIEDLSRAIEIDPDSFFAYVIRGFAYDDTAQFLFAISDYSSAIDLDPGFANGYFWRGMDYGVLGEGELAIADLEKALELGLEPELSQKAEAVLVDLYEYGQLQVSYDGTWQGTTDQGEKIELTIENNAVSAILVGFSIPGCEGDSPLSSWFGTPEFFIENNQVEIKMTGLYLISISGIFDSPNAVSGDLEISSNNRCNQGLHSTWSAVPSGFYVPPPLPEELMGTIPDSEIPDDLFDSGTGSEKFSVYSAILGQEGDWYLLQSIDSVIPVPAGWTTLGTGKEDIVLAFHRSGLEYPGYGGTESFNIEPEVFIVAGRFWSDTSTPGEIIIAANEAFSQEPNFKIIKQEMVDDKRAYIFFRVDREQEYDFYRIYLFSETPDGWVRLFDVVVDVLVWDDYYSVVQEITSNWLYSGDNSTLGVDLPDSLFK